MGEKIDSNNNPLDFVVGLQPGMSVEKQLDLANTLIEELLDSGCLGLYETAKVHKYWGVDCT